MPSNKELSTIVANHAQQIAVHTNQLGRIVSDIESEKRTRATVNSTIIGRLDVQDERQRKSDRYIYLGIGGVTVLQFVLMFLVSLKKA